MSDFVSKVLTDRVIDSAVLTQERRLPYFTVRCTGNEDGFHAGVALGNKNNGPLKLSDLGQRVLKRLSEYAEKNHQCVHVLEVGDRQMFEAHLKWYVFDGNTKNTVLFLCKEAGIYHEVISRLYLETQGLYILGRDEGSLTQLSFGKRMRKIWHNTLCKLLPLSSG